MAYLSQGGTNDFLKRYTNIHASRIFHFPELHPQLPLIGHSNQTIRWDLNPRLSA